MRRNARFLLVAATLAVVLAVLVSRLAPSHQPTTLPAQQASCGRAVNNTFGGYDARPTDCLWLAYSAGGAAQAIVVQYTTEGDPITYGVKVSSSTQIGVSIQSQDRFGPRGSFQYSCHGLTRQPYGSLSEHFLLVVTDCAGPRDFLDGSRLIIP